MLMPDFERVLDVVVTSQHPTSLTLTEAPRRSSDLAEMLESAIRTGDRARSRLTRIELPAGSFPELGSAFRHVPVGDSGREDVVRLFFAP